eukprot:RCo033813
MSLDVAPEAAPDMREYLMSRRPKPSAAGPAPKQVVMKEGTCGGSGSTEDDEEVDEGIAAEAACGACAEALGTSAVDPTDKLELEDQELEALRKRRIAQLRQEVELKAKGHGQLTEISEPEFLKEVTSSPHVLVHFYHREFEKCKVMDKHLRELAFSMMAVKFLKLDAEKARFFVGKLAIRTLPTVVFFRDGVAFGRVVGFEGLGSEDHGGEDFSPEALGTRIREGFSSSVPLE